METLYRSISSVFVPLSSHIFLYYFGKNIIKFYLFVDNEAIFILPDFIIDSLYFGFT